MEKVEMGSRCISLFAGLLALAVQVASATSFDCNKASLYSEVTICGSKELQRLDETIASKYLKLLDQTAPSFKNNVREVQRTWLKVRDACTTLDCVKTALSNRIVQIDLLTTDLGPAPSKPEAVQSKPVPSASQANSPKTAQIAPVAPQQTTTVPSHAYDPSATSASPAGATQSHQRELSFLPLKIALVAVAIILVLSIYFHHTGRMTIYHDYTDATWTSLTPLLGVGTYWLLLWLECPSKYAAVAAIAVFALMSLQVIRRTFQSNGFSLYFLMALIAKLTLIVGYYFIIAFLVFGDTKTKRDRRRRNGALAAATALFVVISGWICRDRQFRSIGDYLSGNTAP